jgi:hypothetical protein
LFFFKYFLLSGFVSRMSETPDAAAFIRELQAILRRQDSTRQRGIEEAIGFARAMLASLEPERAKLIAQHNNAMANLKVLEENAKKSGSLEDGCALSKAMAECVELGKMLEDGVKVYSTVFEELKKLQRFETARVAPIVPPVGVSVERLHREVAALTIEMVGFWSAYDDSGEHRKESHEKLQCGDGKELAVHIADVRGDGACGWRAFISGVVRIITGGRKRLPYDPVGLPDFLARIKVLVLELVQLLQQNPDNRDFITALFKNPDNGQPNTFETYRVMVTNQAYQATNYELRLLCVLFGLFDAQLTQVNIIRQTPSFGEIYQSISATGQIQPVSNGHINILHVPGHYKSIFYLTQGVLPRIYPVENPLVL